MTRALKFIKFCCDECGEAEEDLFSFPNMIGLHVGISTAFNKFYRQPGQNMGHWPVGAYGVRSEHIRFTRLSKVLFTTSICA